MSAKLKKSAPTADPNRIFICHLHRGKWQILPARFLGAGREGYDGRALLADGRIVLFDDAFAFASESEAQKFISECSKGNGK